MHSGTCVFSGIHCTLFCIPIQLHSTLHILDLETFHLEIIIQLSTMERVGSLQKPLKKSVIPVCMSLQILSIHQANDMQMTTESVWDSRREQYRGQWAILRKLFAPSHHSRYKTQYWLQSETFFKIFFIKAFFSLQQCVCVGCVCACVRLSPVESKFLPADEQFLESQTMTSQWSWTWWQRQWPPVRRKARTWPAQRILTVGLTMGWRSHWMAAFTPPTPCLRWQPGLHCGTQSGRWRRIPRGKGRLSRLGNKGQALTAAGSILAHSYHSSDLPGTHNLHSPPTPNPLHQSLHSTSCPAHL